MEGTRHLSAMSVNIGRDCLERHQAVIRIIQRPLWRVQGLNRRNAFGRRREVRRELEESWVSVYVPVTFSDRYFKPVQCRSL
jgi:hypothetical protein